MAEKVTKTMKDKKGSGLAAAKELWNASKLQNDPTKEIKRRGAFNVDPKLSKTWPQKTENIIVE